METKVFGHFDDTNREYVVAVGGDGTVNEVARGVRDTETALGVIPIGSGDGFARHIGVPLRAQRAIEMLNHSEAVKADYGLANDRLFVTTCGTGFDALIAYHFAKDGSRGFVTYLKKILQDVLTYKTETYRLTCEDGTEIEQRAFLLTFANANQWGNDAYIAPKASIQDGKMDICIMSTHVLLGAPELALRLFTKSIDGSLFMNTLRMREVTLHRETEAPFHIDGDPVEMPQDVHIKIVEDGLRVLVEKRF